MTGGRFAALPLVLVALFALGSRPALACGAPPAGVASTNVVMNYVVDGGGGASTGPRSAVATWRAGQVAYDSTNNRLIVCDGTAWRNILASAGTAAAAAGSSGQIQFNDAGSLGADAGLFWDNANKRLGIGTATPFAPIEVIQSTGNVFRAGMGGSLFYTNAQTMAAVGQINYTDATTTISNIRPGFAIINNDTTTGNAASLTLGTLNTGGGTFGGVTLASVFSTARPAAGSSAADFVILSGGIGVTTEKLRILANGNIGIGTATPSAPLQVMFGSYSNPATSGSTQTGSSLRLTSQGVTTLDFGSNNAGTAWIQNTATANLSQNYSLAINPNGGNVGIGTTSPAAILDISSTTSGFLPPRMTTSQRNAIASPVAGMVIFNTTTNQLEVRNSTTWTAAGGGSASMRLTAQSAEPEPCSAGSDGLLALTSLYTLCVCRSSVGWISTVNGATCGWSFAATGGTITNITGWRIHTFTSSGTFTVTSGTANVEYLVVGGGGGGGGAATSSMVGNGGGGGGGGVRVGSLTLGPGTYTVTVGTGGTGGGVSGAATNGGDSTFDTLTAIGGGRGGTYAGLNPATGGSGGGAGYATSVGSGTAGQGNAGGNWSNNAPNYGSGGGGGANSAGTNGTNLGGGAGGNGLTSSISGAAVVYGSGGGGGSSGGTPGAGGTNAGTGAINNTTPVAAIANRGGGGGGGGNAGSQTSNGGNGGSGIVIVRYSN